MYAEVAVNTAAPIRQTFTYRIPEGLDVQPGHAVYVPFGARTLQGIVMEVTDVPAFAEARDVEGLIEERPLVSPERLEVAEWMARYYLSPLFDCVSLMLPAGFKRKPLTFLRTAFWTPESAGEDVPDAERAMLDIVAERGEVEADELKRAVKGGARAMGSLVRRGLLARTYRLARPSVATKITRELRLLISEAAAAAQARDLRDSGARGSGRRAVVLGVLADEGVLPMTRARALGLTAAMLRDFEAHGIAVVEDVQVVRNPLAGREYAHHAPPTLTADQAHAAEAICAAVSTGVRAGALTHGGERARSFLLHGVTGSGKTEVYLAALDRAVALGRRGIVLVPEIALTPQTVRRFAERFPGRVAVMHSELSLGEHFDMWHAVREGRFDVVIGPRGALFAPQPDLGLVIIDEEHEWTYKQQEGSPRYHARLAAEELCRRAGAVLVLGSATPDVESHFRAQDGGSIELLELRERLIRTDEGVVQPAPLPEVEVVDLREELKSGNRSIFSRELTRAILHALSEKEQVMLFLNRRGSASFVQCRDCGHVPECKSCAAALTLHADGRLVCHYCGRRYPMPTACPECDGRRIRQIGLGTERVEQEAREAFPGARTVRWDRDVIRGRESHETILAKFMAHEADILIGTQMIAKGLDIPLVTLVGVVSADIALHLPDFRAGERTYQLLEQVSGRAGRGPRGGRVIIQTYTPDHYAIEAAALHDYHEMFQREIDHRRRMGYPPFGRLVRMMFAHTNSEYAQKQATIMARRLGEERDRLGLPNLDVLGPAPAFVARIRGRWRWNIILRGGEPSALIADMQLPRGWTVDVDPASVL